MIYICNLIMSVFSIAEEETPLAEQNPKKIKIMVDFVS